MPFVFFFKKSLEDVKAVFIMTNIFALVIRLQKTSRRLDQDKNICLIHMSSKRLQDVLLWRSQDVLRKRLEDFFKTSWRCLEDVLTKSWRCFQDILMKSCQEVFQTSSKLLQDILQRLTFSRRLQDVSLN